MNFRNVKILDCSGTVRATARVTDRRGVFEGIIDLRETSPELLALFVEFEEIVNGQMFSFLDEVQLRISACVNRACFDDGGELPIRDLQVFPNAGEISFRAAGICATV